MFQFPFGRITEERDVSQNFCASNGRLWVSHTPSSPCLWLRTAMECVHWMCLDGYLREVMYG